MGIILFLRVVVIPHHKAIAQSPITIALLNESTSMPFTSPRMAPFHPGVEVGTDFPLYENQHHKTYFTITLRYIFHKELYKALTVRFGFGYDLKMA